jgi:hypothetical protein
MNLDWLLSPITFYATLLIGGTASMQLIISTRRDLRRRQRQQQNESVTLKEALAALQGKLDEMSQEAADRAAMEASWKPARSLGLNQRAEALRMYRRGLDAQAVASSLGIPRAESELLRKVQQVLRSEA